MLSEKIPDEIWEAARALHSAVLWESNSSVEHIARALMAEREKASDQYANLISIIADIRMKSGVGAKPMLSELADAIAAQLTASRAECEGLRAAIRALLDCPDIADNDYKDEETHAAERVARAALSGSGSGSGWQDEHIQRFTEALCAEDIGDPLRASGPILETVAKRVLDYVFRPLSAAPQPKGE